MDKEKMDEERRRRHERRRERKEREAKEGKSKDSSRSSRPRKAHGLDVIDKLDVTGIYGQGCEYHHRKLSTFSDSIFSLPPRWTI